MENEEPRSKTCPCPHHRIVPLGVALIGLAFLANALGWYGDAALAYTWPLLLVIIGGTKLAERRCACC